jgi:hypothetical protein
VSCCGEARGLRPLVPQKSLSSCVRFLGTPTGRGPFDQRARLGLRPSSFRGNGKREGGDAHYLVQPGSQKGGSLAAVRPPRLTILAFLPYLPAWRRRADPRGR